MVNYIISYLLPIIILITISLIGFLITFVGLPGLFVITAGAFIYGLMTHFSEITLVTVVILLVIAIAAELIEFLSGILFAKRFKVSKNGIIGGVIGAIAGVAVGVPIPVIGSLIGMFLGAFLGAVLFEYQKNKDKKLALMAGLGILLGRVGAILIKAALAVVMLIIIFGKVF